MVLDILAGEPPTIKKAPPAPSTAVHEAATHTLAEARVRRVDCRIALATERAQPAAFDISHSDRN
jgi:hypothetical protein